ncbi:hypothetical protein BKA65DRAFT_253924 [Rhexocercosporidium sp. MPI-PUGE-AT-0058]|nr:hypothetical protein BKA65DRAFT_253924 [Rhexocercosporidium sp. MPI-PUGE-AT-0058]
MSLVVLALVVLAIAVALQYSGSWEVLPLITLSLSCMLIPGFSGQSFDRGADSPWRLWLKIEEVRSRFLLQNQLFGGLPEPIDSFPALIERISAICSSPSQMVSVR